MEGTTFTSNIDVQSNNKRQEFKLGSDNLILDSFLLKAPAYVQSVINKCLHLLR